MATLVIYHTLRLFVYFHKAFNMINYQLIKSATGDIVQIGCEDIAKHTELMNFCRRHRKRLITYCLTETDKENSNYHGTYHIQRVWDASVDLSKFSYIIENK